MRVGLFECQAQGDHVEGVDDRVSHFFNPSGDQAASAARRVVVRPQGLADLVHNGGGLIEPRDRLGVCEEGGQQHGDAVVGVGAYCLNTGALVASGYVGACILLFGI